MERRCETCLFGFFAPDRFTAKHGKPARADAPSVWHCTINPPTFPSGHPFVEGGAVCSMFTTRDAKPTQPLRSLSGGNRVPGFTVRVKG